jgi:class 3 adenylate cyclase
MCRSLGRDILVSQAFADAVADAVPESRARLVPLGSHRLRGVTREQALHAVAPAERARGEGGEGERER